MNFSTLVALVEVWVRSPPKIDNYGYVVMPSGKISPVGDMYGHLDFIVRSYDKLPEKAKEIVDNARDIGEDHEFVCDFIAGDCENFYRILVEAGWMLISTSDDSYLYFTVNDFSSKTKKKIANTIVDLPKSVLDRGLTIVSVRPHKVEDYDSCRDFLRGDE